MCRWRGLRSRDDPAEDIARVATSLFVEEYKTVREAIYVAFSTAQAIVRWSLAVFGVVLGAGLVAANGAAIASDSKHFIGIAVLFLFGCFLPAFIWSSALAWLGEIIRVQRATAYLRDFEARVAAIPGMVSVLSGPPIRFSTAVFAAPSPRSRQLAATLGTFVVFLVAAATSAFLFVVLIVSAEPTNWPELGFIVATVVIHGSGATVNVLAARRILRIRSLK